MHSHVKAWREADPRDPDDGGVTTGVEQCLQRLRPRIPRVCVARAGIRLGGRRGFPLPGISRLKEERGPEEGRKGRREGSVGVDWRRRGRGKANGCITPDGGTRVPCHRSQMAGSKGVWNAGTN
ncbi:hypothetical protein Naga_101138g2 [Nannochloropsis gaditana]|uniref:Uncharacterized protein n=1 Tax=Nannochloropsis gaditana TaxID=72520 RepID=W7TCK7_9STRA|nr:hypothetical protein Naga_101138g2 [Nannochloropsis gaditana]